MVNNGEQAMDYLARETRFAAGRRAIRRSCCWMSSCRWWMVSKCCSRYGPTLPRDACRWSYLTASNQERDRQRAYELGANGYVVKTIDFEADTAALHAIAQYWAMSNEPPAGCLPRPKPERRRTEACHEFSVANRLPGR